MLGGPRALQRLERVVHHRRGRPLAPDQRALSRLGQTKPPRRSLGLVLESHAPLLATPRRAGRRLLLVAKEHPLLFGMVFTGAKTAAADALVCLHLARVTLALSLPPSSACLRGPG